LGWAAASGHEFVSPFYRESARKKRPVARRRPVGASRPARRRRLATGQPDHYVAGSRKAQTEGRALPVNRSFWQVVGFVVLAAVVLATGFGAL
jgi:hypothetical protein